MVTRGLNQRVKSQRKLAFLWQSIAAIDFSREPPLHCYIVKVSLLGVTGTYEIGVKLIWNTSMLKVCAWLTLLFLLSVLLVWLGASRGVLPALGDIGSTGFGLPLLGFWLLGL